MGRKLFVGNLSYNVGEAELHALFERIGTVDTVTIMRDLATGRARGFAFVEMRTEDDARRPRGVERRRSGRPQADRERTAPDACVHRRWRKWIRRWLTTLKRAALVNTSSSVSRQAGSHPRCS